MKNFSDYHLANSPCVKGDVPGPKSRTLLELQSKIEGNIVSYPKAFPIAIKRAKGAIIEDVDGNLFIDFFAGCGVVNLGHCNDDILRRVVEQQKSLIHALDFPTENKLTLIQTMLNQFPEDIRDDLKVSFCGPTGADAVEAAIKLARHYTGRKTVIAFQGSYHGLTSGALATTSDVRYKERIQSGITDVHFIPYSYCYRCPFNRDSDSCQLDCASYLESILENPQSGVPLPAAIILEPIQGEGGNIVPKEGFLERIVEIAHRHGVVVIFDEIQCGFFRSGHFLAAQASDATPDIYTLSKGLGGVGFPISAIVYNKRIESWGTGFHVGTFRGNQVSIASAQAAFNFVKEQAVTDHVKSISKYMMEKLDAMKETFLNVGDVRGVGLMIGVELVHSRSSKKPYPELAQKIRIECTKKGLLFEVGGHYNNVLRFVPPLIINKEIVDHSLGILEESMTETLSFINSVSTEN